MCGRLAISLPKEAMTELFKAAPANDLPQTPNYNVCPTDNIHTVDKGTRHRLPRTFEMGLSNYLSEL